MPNLSVKDVPEALAEALRQRAARNHRSLQGELMAILETAVSSPPLAPQAHLAPPPPDWRSRLIPLKGRQPGTLTASDIVAENRRSRPQPRHSSSSVTLIRQMRDEHYGEAWVAAGIKDGPCPPQTPPTKDSP